MLKMK